MIDTAIIQRLRNQLLERGPASLLGPNGATLDNLAPLQLASLQRVAPLAELLFLMLSADGSKAGEELVTIRGAVRALTDGLLRGVTADQLVDRFQTALDEEGVEARLAEVTARLAADREEAEVGVMLAAAVALADDHVDAREQALFEEIAEQLGIGKRRLDELLGKR